MSHDVEHYIISLRGKNGTTSSYEIRQLVRLVLQEFGYPQIVESFERGKHQNMSDIERHQKAIAEHQAALYELLRQEGGLEEVHEDRDAAPQEMMEEPESEKELDIDYKFTNMKTEHYKNREK